jgi:hypothetical protein
MMNTAVGYPAHRVIGWDAQQIGGAFEAIHEGFQAGMECGK